MAIVCAIAELFSALIRACSASTFAVSSPASSMWSSIVKSNCCGTGTLEADLPAITLAPMDGGGGGPLLDDAG